MVIWFHELEATLFLSQVLSDGCTGLVICDGKGWLVSLVREGLEDFFVCSDDVVVGRGRNGYGEDVIGIVCVGNEKQLLSLEGSGW